MKSWYNRNGNKKRKIIIFILIGVIIGISISGVVLFKKENMDVWLNAQNIEALESEKIYYATQITDRGRLSNSPELCFTIKDDGMLIILQYLPEKITEENQNQYFLEGDISITRYVKGRYEKNSLNYDLLESETEMVSLVFGNYEEVKEHTPSKIQRIETGEYKIGMGHIPNKICKDEQGWKMRCTCYHEYLISEGKNEKLPESADEFLADYQ